VSRGTVQEKLQWIFGLYDLNGDGLITKKEMLEVVASIYEMLGRSTQPQVDEHSAKEHVEKIFHVSIFQFLFIFLIFYTMVYINIREYF
jgi:Ca2+-binding EF-hand superfamily protein